MTDNATPTVPSPADLSDFVSKAMRRAWQLGQTYWQQADSESYAANRRSEKTQAMFDALVDEVRAALAAQPVPDSVLVAPDKDALTDLIAGLLGGTYHCTRVWHAWDVGTMSADDFQPLDESDTPAEIADVVLAMHVGAAPIAQPCADLLALVDAYGQACADVATTGHVTATAYAALARSQLMDAIAAAHLQQSTPQPLVLKGIGKINGDGWKDTTHIEEVVYVWNRPMPEPYAPGQFTRVGYPIWTASTTQYDFRPVADDEAIAVIDRSMEELRMEVVSLKERAAGIGTAQVSKHD